MAAAESDAPRERELTPAAIAEKRDLRARRLLLLPAIALILTFGVLPLFIILIYSFLEPGAYGGVKWEFSTDAYVQFLFERDLFDETLTFTTAYLEIYWRSLSLAAITTVFSLLIGFPCAYVIATKPESQRNIWLFLITIPFWTNLLIRTYAMLLIVRDQGLINNFLIGIGVIDQPIVILYTDFAVGLGLIYSYLPFMVLPIYASLEKLDFRLVEAGYDLYADRGKVLRRIVVPLAMPGVVAGSILVFIPSLGSFITPVLLGGGTELMIGNMIQLQFGSSRNWPFGSAAALILMSTVLIALVVYVKNSSRIRAGQS